MIRCKKHADCRKYRAIGLACAKDRNIKGNTNFAANYHNSNYYTSLSGSSSFNDNSPCEDGMSYANNSDNNEEHSMCSSYYSGTIVEDYFCSDSFCRGGSYNGYTSFTTSSFDDEDNSDCFSSYPSLDDVGYLIR